MSVRAAAALSHMPVLTDNVRRRVVLSMLLHAFAVVAGNCCSGNFPRKLFFSNGTEVPYQ